jgi:hypothetical protein
MFGGHSNFKHYESIAIIFENRILRTDEHLEKTDFRSLTTCRINELRNNSSRNQGYLEVPTEQKKCRSACGLNGIALSGVCADRVLLDDAPIAAHVLALQRVPQSASAWPATFTT